MEEDEDCDREQAILDEHEEKISNTVDHLYILLHSAKPTIGVFDDPRPNIDKRLSHVDSGLARILHEMKEVKSRPDMDRCLLEQLGKQLSGLKLELFDASQSILCTSSVQA